MKMQQQLFFKTSTRLLDTVTLVPVRHETATPAAPTSLTYRLCGGAGRCSMVQSCELAGAASESSSPDPAPHEFDKKCCGCAFQAPWRRQQVLLG